MVSLSKKERMSFSNSSINQDECDFDRAVVGSSITNNSDTVMQQPLISSVNIVGISNNSEFSFKPIETIATGILMIASAIALFIGSMVMPIECEVGHVCYVNTSSLFLYLHCLFWGIALITDQCIRYQHIMLRRRGYLEFYSETRTLSQLPFWIVSTWSTLLLSISTILHDYCKADGTCGNFIPFKMSEYITFCIGLELIVLIPVLVTYLCKVWKFNHSRSVPDVLRDDQMATTPEFGLNSLGRIDDEIYQRQADLIHYYKEQNAMLRKTVLELNRQICSRPTTA